MPPFQTPALDGFCGDLIDLCVSADVKETGHQSVDKELRRRHTSAALKRSSQETGLLASSAQGWTPPQKKAKYVQGDTGAEGGAHGVDSNCMKEEEDTKGLKGSWRSYRTLPLRCPGAEGRFCASNPRASSSAVRDGIGGGDGLCRR